MSKKWARIYLVSGTRIRRWIRNQTLNIVVERRRISGKTIKILSIRGAEASFVGGGSVIVKMPGSSQWWVAFSPLEVLKIVKGKEEIVNHYFCEKCFANTCKAVGEPRSMGTGRQDFDFQCSICGHRATRRI